MEEETVENRLGFAGEMLDAVTGQYYLRARFYNPVIARFLSEDTYYGDGLNLYAYCHNNPVGYVDPSGHLCEKKQYKLEQYKEYLKQGIDKKEAYQKANYDAIKKYNGLEAAERYRKSHQNTNPVYEQNQKKSNGAGSDSKTSYGKSSGKYDTTADFLTNIENRNGKFYTDKATIDKIGQVEARGEDFSLLNKRIMSSRASTEGGTSVVYKYSDELGTKYLIHEVTDARGYIIHRDFDAVRISSGQLINKGH